MLDLSGCSFAPVMDYPDDLYVFDLSIGYDKEFIATKKWAVGKYNEQRENMYVAPQYNNTRNIHMGIDLWADPGEPVYAFYEGKIAYQRDNNQKGNYGPTIVTKHEIGGQIIYALFGHLSRESLNYFCIGDEIEKGQRIAKLGREEVNGGWLPHLHFQLSLQDPGEADMPGVVSEQDHKRALELYPDPRIVLGNLY